MSLLKSIKFGQTTACRDSRRSRVFVPKVVCFMTSEERQAMNDPTKSEPMKMYLRTRDETALFVAHEGSEYTGRRQCLSHGGSSEAHRGTVLATKAVETQGDGAVLATKTVEK